jgi:transcriptional regulator with XRE-family HTH domain
MAAAKATKLGLTQEAIAAELAISQSQVSRVLSGKSRRASRVCVRVCEYVENLAAPGPRRRAPISPELAQAVTGVWDGTTEHAELLAALLNTLSALAAYQKGRKHQSS